MEIIFLIIIGAAAGYIATRVMDVKANILATVGIGVLGALLGGLILRFLLLLTGLLAGFIGAVLGAVLLIWLWRSYV